MITENHFYFANISATKPWIFKTLVHKIVIEHLKKNRKCVRTSKKRARMFYRVHTHLWLVRTHVWTDVDKKILAVTFYVVS